MRQLLGRRSIGVSLAVVAVGLLASGCDWVGFGNGSQHGGYVFETSITPANVSTLAPQFSVTDGALFVTPEAVVNGILYGYSSVNGLEAYSGGGTSGCSGSPAVCAPLWDYAGSVGSAGIMVSNGVVYVSGTSGLKAYDAAGLTNCSGTRSLCQPLWSASGSFTPPTVANGTVFVTTSATLEAFDASGNKDCSGTPKTCAPMWTASNAYGTVSAAAGIVYTQSNVTQSANGGGIAGFDANGVKGCSGSPKICAPLWQYATNYPISNGDIVISGTELYVTTFSSQMPRQFSGDIEAFDANGKAGCAGAPPVCSPIWTDPAISINSPLLAGDGSLFVTEPGPFGIFALNLTSGSPEWGATNAASGQLVTDAVGGSVLYASDSTKVSAYDAGGTSGCSGSPPICTALWSVPGSVAIVANGLVYVSTTDPAGGEEIIAYGLPTSS
jgi:hypothetical protein